MDCDVIVIGSGAGGLAAAVALARAGKRVVVFEQHYLPGGWTHSFSLGGYRFSPGVHYIGRLHEGGLLRRVFEGLDLDMAFLELNPDGYDHILIGDERFDIPAGKERYAERLIAKFPKEREGIRGYLDTCERIWKELEGGTRVTGFRDALTAPWRLRTVLRHGLTTLDTFLDRFTRDPLLRGILAMQVGDHGLPPSQAPTALQAAVVGHYLEGAWYPMGGGRAIPKALIGQLRANGGTIHLSTEVTRLLVEGRKVVGVQLADGTEVHAPIVVSNADPGVTWGRLMDPADVPPAIRRKLDRSKWSLSSLSLFFAADIDARGAGLDSGNFWYTRTADIESVYNLATRPRLDDLDEIPGVFLTCTTLKDPTKRHHGPHTFESFCFVSHEAFQRWVGSTLGDRDAAYTALKERLTDMMFDTLHRFVPGLRDRVVFQELGTPLTNQFYCAGTQGNLYGTAKSRWQVGPFSWPVRTPFEGLYQCGASTLGHGVAGAMLSGLAAARFALGVERDALLTGKGQITLLPSEDIGAWPAEWQRKAGAEREVA